MRPSEARPAPAAAPQRPSKVHVGSSAVFSPESFGFWFVQWRLAEIAQGGQRRVCDVHYSSLLPLLPLRKMLRQKIRQHLDAGGARAAGRRHQMHRTLGLLPVKPKTKTLR